MRAGPSIGTCAAIALAVLPRCGGDEAMLRPLAVEDAGAGADTAVDAAVDAPVEALGDAPAPPAEAGIRIRTVERRNPFGAASSGANLLVDGDFELTSGGGQYGWRALDGAGETTLGRETGGLCHSGVTCASMANDVSLIAFGAAPRDSAMEASLWAKPSGADCDGVSVSLIECSSSFPVDIAAVPPVSTAPDAAGWCHYLAVVPKIEDQPCLYVSISATRALVDEGSLIAADASGSRPRSRSTPSAALFARMARDLDWLRRNRRFGR